MITSDRQSQSAFASYFNRGISDQARALTKDVALQQRISRQAPWQRVSILPVYRESPDCLEQLALPEPDKHLLIVIANRPDTDPDVSWLRPWQRALPSSEQQSRHHLTTHPAAGDILWLDFASQQGIPASQGVGLARKIAADFACLQISEQRVLSPWIHSLDADTRLPQDYFSHTDNLTDYSAVTYPFRHIGNPEDPHHRATLVYEWHILRYALGLKRAGSMHSWIALGSAMAVHAADYARVRGFPNRPAGEDFYLLNKLSKVRPVLCASGQAIQIHSRLSDRVPFGTGPSAQRISALNDVMLWPSRHPAVFEMLKEYREKLILSLDTDIHEQMFDKPSLDAIQKARSASPDRGRQYRHLLAWFDAFQELKRIHFYRDHYHPDRPIKELISLDREAKLDLSESHFEPTGSANLIQANQRMQQVLFDNSNQGASSAQLKPHEHRREKA